MAHELEQPLQGEWALKIEFLTYNATEV
jgi:hypothetical protein